jgi:hypothetical protein
MKMLGKNMFRKIVFLLFLSFSAKSQKDTLSHCGLLGRTKSVYAFEKRLLLLKAGVNLGSHLITKNNFGFEGEYAVTNVVGFTVGYSIATYNPPIYNNPYGTYDAPSYYGYGSFGNGSNEKTHYNTVNLGVKLHTAFMHKTKIFDVAPGLSWSSYNTPIALNPKSLLSISADVRAFVAPHIGLNFNLATGVSDKTRMGYNIGLVFK